MEPGLFLILARARNGTIGVDGRLPWHIPADLARFKSLTMGKPMIMGRKTFESLPGLLPGRTHIVLTRQRDWRAPGASVANSVAQALEIARRSGADEIAVIGGAQIYAAFAPLAERIELTQVEAEVHGDTFFDLDEEGWRVSAQERHEASASAPAFSFVTLERARSEKSDRERAR